MLWDAVDNRPEGVVVLKIRSVDSFLANRAFGVGKACEFEQAGFSNLLGERLDIRSNLGCLILILSLGCRMGVDRNPISIPSQTVISYCRSGTNTDSFPTSSAVP
ncbi:hypothetical protein [Halorussus amylolyticus]|uniref:hypothetical protein n=1 Tax=Halorussus amylolyticus TaxID=1126242 RepID=UPI0010429598|nr:hypothetical protein [Halorussus amylolyticus]